MNSWMIRQFSMPVSVICFSLILTSYLTMSCGGGGSSNSPTPPYTPGGSGTSFTSTHLSLFVGDVGGQGNADGTGVLARFDFPSGIVCDSSGNIFVADSNANTIRKITSGGIVTTFAGSPGISGQGDGHGTAARFKAPTGLAIDGSNNIYVADNGNNIIRKITSIGAVTILAGSAGLSGSTNGTGSAARFNGPQGIATDSTGNIFVSDSNNGLIRKITPDGTVSTLVGTSGVTGFIPGTLPGVLISPSALAIQNNLMYIVLLNGLAQIK